MSVVAVLVEDKITIGADSILVRGYTQNKDAKAKLFKVSDSFAIGGSGLARDISLLFIFAKTHSPEYATVDGLISFFDEFGDWVKKKTDRQMMNDTTFIVVFNGKAFYFEDFYIREVEDYFAIGAGRDYAMTALYLGHSVEDAIKVACELSIYCEPPITTLDFQRAK